MYALLALGFTLVYGILELINFAHFNVFMIGSFVGLYVLEAMGLSGQNVILAGFPLAYAVIRRSPLLALLISGLIWLAAALDPGLNLPNWLV